MRSLPPPDRSAVRAHLEAALEVYVYRGVQRGYAVTEAEIQQILALYNDYDANLGAPTDAFKGPHLHDDLRVSVEDAYRFVTRTGRLKAVRRCVEAQVELCPVCGIDPPSELDHHLPKGTFKPLAIYVRNLVPYCHHCNHTKGTYIPNNAAEEFFHPYFDQLPDVQFFSALIELEHGALVVEYGIDQAVQVEQGLKTRLANQLERLRLNERFQREQNIYLAGHEVALFDAFKGDGKLGVRSFLSRQAEAERRRFHRNHWRPVLLGALSAHEEFCDRGFSVLYPNAPENAPDDLALAT